MKQEHVIHACGGKAMDVLKDQTITIIDPEGSQVVDFFAEAARDPNEFLSTGVTIDCNESLRLKVGSLIYTNLYRPMFQVLLDDVGEHDLLHPCCRPEMYGFFYHNAQGHPNCLDNINASLKRQRPIIHPVNFFMHTSIHADGSICVERPLSKPGDRVVLKALMDARLGVAACSVSESKCNGGRCSPIKIVIEGRQGQGMKPIVIESERLRIAPRGMEEMEALRNQETGPELKQAYAEMMKAMLNLPGQEEWGADWKISLKAGPVIGGICFKGAPDSQGTVEIGYGIDEAYRRNGYAAEAVGGIAKWALRQAGVRCVAGQTAPDNIPSQRVLLKNGFVREGDGAEGPLYILRGTLYGS